MIGYDSSSSFSSCSYIRFRKDSDLKVSSALFEEKLPPGLPIRLSDRVDFSELIEKHDIPEFLSNSLRLDGLKPRFVLLASMH